MSALSDLARVAKQQGIAAAVAIALLVLVGYMMREQFKAGEQSRTDVAALGDEIDALADLTIATCGATTAEVQKFEIAKQTRREATKR
jgi:hypothetical protein